MTAHVASGKIVWLASYPRSGNTWIRFLLYNLLFGTPESVSDVEGVIPDIHFLLSQATEASKIENVIEEILCYESILLKTHFTLDVLASRPFTELLENTAGFIYIVRNPTEVLASNINYSLLTSYNHEISVDNNDCEIDREQKLNVLRTNLINEFIENKGTTFWQELGYGQWDEHINSWLHNTLDIPFIVIRYEDLIANTYQQLKRTGEFLCVDFTEESLSNTVKNSSFQILKEFEEKAISHHEISAFYMSSCKSAYHAGYRFMNQGKSGYGKELLSPEQLSQLHEKFHNTTPAFEYLGNLEAEQRSLELSSDSSQFQLLNLHIGGKESRKNWKVLDIEERSEVDFIGDAANLVEFSDNSVNTIYASHVLEHFYYGLNNELAKTLKEWYRVLRPGGKLMISVPDLQRLCWLYVSPDISFQERYMLMRVMFGGQVNEYDVHKVGFDFEILANYLQQAGFQKLDRVHTFDLFADCSSLQIRGTLISLNVIATKKL